ncbi:UDP-glucuronate 4-epimerase 6-like [Elaeis guineensis]|uniref:UDP-glucuronate 4-epimerase 6-like n=1 Tax=Elaeis guineensis var. tenera TaxID=51953 RepID=A0A6I9QXC8_ELAGV|nr:UDP-glucuronate 4-epimerase 6-like [Elaeis guineensis]
MPFTHILHLASLPANTSLNHLNFVAFAYANADALIALLELARTIDYPPAIVWASSAFVYGLNPTSNPTVKSDPTDHLATLFAAGKKTAEDIYAYSHIYGLSITTLCLFTIYDLWARPHMAYFTFTKAIHHDFCFGY